MHHELLNRGQVNPSAQCCAELLSCLRLGWFIFLCFTINELIFSWNSVPGRGVPMLEWQVLRLGGVSLQWILGLCRRVRRKWLPKYTRWETCCSLIVHCSVVEQWKTNLNRESILNHAEIEPCHGDVEYNTSDVRVKDHFQVLSTVKAHICDYLYSCLQYYQLNEMWLIHT